MTTSKKSATIRMDYYLIRLPGDMEDNLKDMENHAIEEARCRTQVWAWPAEWRVTHISGHPGDSEVVFQVRRTRSRTGIRV